MIATSPMPSTAAAAASADNPFFSPSPLPYQLPQFDLIEDAHYASAFAEGMRQQLAEIAVIADSGAPATFDNTIVALERSGRLLARVLDVFFNLAGANTNDAMQAVELELAPQLAAHGDRIKLNPKLFERIQTLYRQRPQLGLDPESLRLLERYHTDFIRAGAQLAAADKDQLRRMNTALATLSTSFSQNLLKETNAAALLLDRPEQLAGLAAPAIAAAASAAKARGLDGKYLLALTNTSSQPVQAELCERAVRQQLRQASLERGCHGGPYDNRAIVLEMVKLRAERAQLLGYPNHAAYVLEDETAQDIGTVNRLLAQMATPAVANARREAAAMQGLIDAGHGNFALEAADWDFYAEKVRKARYDFDETQLRPYLELNNVLQDGVFFAASRLYGIRFEERHDLPVYHPDVRVFEVFNADDSPLALFLFDGYARASKRGGAWMNKYLPQSTLLGSLPVIGNHQNIPKPPAGEATLLTFDEVITMFHEFGHALHGMFSQVQYPRFSGTNVPRDFVEFPSQVNEMWADWPEVLTNYAKHYQTGAPLPQALLDKFLAAKKFNQGFATTEYLAAATLDQRWHQLTPQQLPTDVLAFEAQALHEAGLDFAPVPPRYRSTYFSHIFASGYSAGYYAYIWSAVLDADSVDWFKENGGLTRHNGERFRRQVLARGGSVDAMTLFRSFRGRDPSITPLLARRGLLDGASES